MDAGRGDSRETTEPKRAWVSIYQVNKNGNSPTRPSV